MRHSWILRQGQPYQEVFTSRHTDACLQLTEKVGEDPVLDISISMVKAIVVWHGSGEALFFAT